MVGSEPIALQVFFPAVSSAIVSQLRQYYCFTRALGMLGPFGLLWLVCGVVLVSRW